MPAIAPAVENLSLDISQETHVRSSLAATFAALLEELGPSNLGQNDVPMPMTLEAWPGGRWFRDLARVVGPLMLSNPVLSNVQYRLKEVDGGTMIAFRHTALGLFPDGYREALSQGFKGIFDRIRRRVE